MAADAECVFCKIIANEIPGFVVLEDPDVVAFLDVKPVFPGHVLVVPRDHHRNLFELPPGEGAELFAVVQRMALAVKTAMEADGVLVISNNGVSQSVDHLHIHVIPRKKKDGLRGFMWPRLKYEADSHASETATLIREAYKGVGA